MSVSNSLFFSNFFTIFKCYYTFAPKAFFRVWIMISFSPLFVFMSFVDSKFLLYFSFLLLLLYKILHDAKYHSNATAKMYIIEWSKVFTRVRIHFLGIICTCANYIMSMMTSKNIYFFYLI